MRCLVRRRCEIRGGPACQLLSAFFKKYLGRDFEAACRAGCVLFMVSAYILFLNPLILSGASSGANTGMPSDSVVAATAISTGVATAFMGVVSRSSHLRTLRSRISPSIATR